MDRQIIYEGFIKNFIIKEKQQRCLFELTTPKRRDEFTNRLNHQIRQIFKIEKLLLIPKKVDFFRFVIDNLKITENEICYVISDSIYDDKFSSFSEIYDDYIKSGSATLVITIKFDKIFLVEEQGFGPPNRWIGKA